MPSASRNPISAALSWRPAGAKAFAVVVFGVVGVLATPTAWAVLGGAASVVSAAPAASKSTGTPAAVQLRSASSAYAVHTTVLDTGTTVQEYTTPGGVVFAVGWQGPVLPRLDALLGNYFAEFTRGAHATRGQRSVGTPLNLESPELVVRSSGRMGRFSGHVIAPSLVPNGVSIDGLFP
jgi:hypothetical protein